MKKNYLFKLLLLLFTITLAVPSFAQIKRGGTPPSFATANRAVQTVQDVKTLQAPDVSALKAEDKIIAKKGFMPRISKILPANYTMENSGEWKKLETGETVWQLRIKSAGAVALSLYYDRFYLPEGSKLYVYSANKKHVVGAFTSADNPKFGPEYATGMVAGDELILEYVAPAVAGKEEALLDLKDKKSVAVTFADNTRIASTRPLKAGAAKADVAKTLSRSDKQPVISISGIGYIYNSAIISVAKEFDEPTSPGDEGSSSACQININCPEGDAWQDQKKGVAATIQVIAGQGWICSGTILNNTEQDFTPYFLMAYHCSEDNEGNVSTAAELNQWEFYFHFEHPGCANTNAEVTNYRMATGAQRLVATNIDGGSDGLLLRLNQDIPDDWNIYFNGWNRSNTPLASGAGIHHPAGDVKKISFVTAPATQATWNGADATGANDAHWLVSWGTVNGKRGVTEGGSSGSPLFDQNGLVVGSLSGGNGGSNPCSNTSMYSLYGKLYWHWDQSPNPDEHMSKYLDPAGTGIVTLDGVYNVLLPEAKFESDSTVYVTQSITYSDESLLATTWEWTFEGGTPASHIGRIPPAIQYNTVGTYTTTLTINKGTASEKDTTKIITVTPPKVAFTASDTAIYATQSINYTDESALATTWEWTFEGGTPSVYTDSVPPAIQYNTAGIYTTTLTINKGLVTESTGTKTITVSVKEAVCTGDITIGAGTATAQFPLGIAQRQAFSAAIYTADELGLSRGGVIKQIAWNAESATTRTRTLYIYLQEVDESAFTPRSWSAETAGAELVYQSAATTTNTAGWNTFALTTPFTYTGTKNLKVLVRSSAGANSGFGNSNTDYTETPDAHQQWTATNTAIPTADGTVNANRPNIRFTVDTLCPPVTPVADFIISGAGILFSEKFDATTIPSGWTVEKPGASANQWTIGYFTYYPFTTIDPSNVYSAIIEWDNPDNVESWLKSPVITIPAGIAPRVSFYMLWGGSYAPAGMLKFYISDDNGATWVQKWVNTNESSMTWRKITLDIPEYAGKNIQLAWQYEGTDLDNAGLDNVIVEDANAQGTAITIFEGESVSFIDRSTTGPPVSWQWAFSGATPATSTETNPSVTYEVAGTYDVSLTVVNHVGSDTKTLTESVTVKKRPLSTVTWKSASNGYTMYPYSGQFLPKTGGTVQLTDISSGSPDLWTWTLPGATPATADTKVAEALYPAGDSTYAVKLKIAHEESAADTAALEIPDYVKVGGVSGIWNVEGGESPTYTYAYMSMFYITGADLFPRTAERFTASEGGLVTKVNIYIASIFSYGDQSMTVGLYSDSNGLPGTLLAEVAVPGASVNSGAYNTITFPTPVTVPKAFHVVVGSTDYYDLYYGVPTVRDRTESGYSTISVDDGTGWYDLGEAIGLYASMNIVPEFAWKSEFELTSADTVKKKHIDQTVETVSFTTSASVWTATAGEPWIQLSAASGTGNGNAQFTFTVAENKTPKFRKGVITVIVDGAYAIITVQQGGAAPENLTAVYEDEKKSVKLAWEKATPPTADMFDDIEAYTPMAINSPGPLGWTYIDGDNADVYNFFSGQITGKMATIAVRWTAATVAHSGYQNLLFISLATNAANNDWMISPKLNFATGFKFSFWARSATANAEQIRIVYSTTGNAQGDFTNIVQNQSIATTTWTKYEYNIPANAKYVAINYVSQYMYYLYIDDIFIGTGTAPASAPASGNQTLTAGAGLDLPTVLTKTAAPAGQSAKAPVKWEARKAQTPVVSPSKDALRLQTLKAGDEAVIRWDDGTLYTGIGAGGGNMEVAAKFEPSDLKDYKHAAIKSVEISVWDLPTNVVLNIRQGGTIVYSQPVSGLTAESFNTIELTEPFSIDVTKDLWVGYSFAYANGEFPAGADDGPAVAGKGDLVSLDGAAFEALSAISNLDYNWNIAVTLVGGDIIGYNVYRDGALIAENVESLEYRDTVPAQGATVCYEVTAVYNEDLFFESDSSNKACLYSKGHLTIGVNDVTREEATNNPAFTAYIKEGIVLATDKADSILTLVKFSTVANSMSSAGTYNIKPLLTDLAASSYADNYVFIPASGVLTVTAFPTVITQQPKGRTICEGEQYTFSVAATGLDVKYQLQQEVNGVWTNVGTPVITSGTRTDASWTLPPITAAHAGNYRVWVDARSDKKYTDVVLLRVGLRDPNLIAYPWSDVPTVNNNPATNGGYTFVEFQWLRDDAAINGATKPYIQVPKGTTANYTVELTTDDNKPLGICSFTPQSTTASLAVYPNPVTQGASLTLQSASLPEGSVANIYSSTGTLVKGNLPLSGVQNTIDITGLTHGFYVLQVSQPDGSKQTVNIVVN